MSESAHAGKTVTCHGDHETGETHDAVTLTYEEHGAFVRHPPQEAGFESSALRFVCPECGRVFWVCPVCSTEPGERDVGPGYFVGETSGEIIPCHNCNQQEINARMRHHGHAGEYPRRRERTGDETLDPEAFL